MKRSAGTVLWSEARTLAPSGVSARTAKLPGPTRRSGEKGRHVAFLAHQPRQFPVVQAPGVEGRAVAIADGHDPGPPAIAGDELEDGVAGHVPGRAARDLDREGLGVRVDAGLAQKRVREFEDPEARDAVAFVVDAGLGLGAHEGGRPLGPAPSRPGHDPADVVRGDTLVRAEVEEFLPAEVVDDLGRHGPVRPAKRAVEEAVHRAFKGQGRIGPGTEEQHSLGPAFGDVLVLVLLGQGQVFWPR